MDATGLKEKEGTPSQMPGSAPMQTRPASQASTVASVQHGSLSPLQFADGSEQQPSTVSASRFAGTSLGNKSRHNRGLVHALA